MKQNYIKKILIKNDVVVVLFNYKLDSGKKIFCFLKSTKDNYTKLQRHLRTGKNIQLSEYGSIIDFGENYPSDGHIDAIKAIYL